MSACELPHSDFCRHRWKDGNGEETIEDSDIIAIKSLLGMDADPTIAKAEPGQFIDQGYLLEFGSVN